MNPLDMTGPSFLTFYLCLLAGAVAMAAALRWALRFPYRGADSEDVALDPYEVAYLTGGEQSAADAAIASLVRSGTVTVNPAGRTISLAGLCRPGLHPLEQALAPDTKGGEYMRRVGVSRRAKPILEKTRKRLTKLGVLMNDGPAQIATQLSTLPILAVLLLGLAKILVGLSRGKSVGFLVVLCVLTVIIVVHFVQKRPYRRSRWGDRMLDHLRQQNAALRLTGSPRAADLESHDLALALALFGTGILAGGPLNDLWTALAPPPTVPWWLHFEPRVSMRLGGGINATEPERE